MSIILKKTTLVLILSILFTLNVFAETSQVNKIDYLLNNTRDIKNNIIKLDTNTVNHHIVIPEIFCSQCLEKVLVYSDKNKLNIDIIFLIHNQDIVAKRATITQIHSYFKTKCDIYFADAKQMKEHFPFDGTNIPQIIIIGDGVKEIIDYDKFIRREI